MNGARVFEAIIGGLLFAVGFVGLFFTWLGFHAY